MSKNKFGHVSGKAEHVDIIKLTELLIKLVNMTVLHYFRHPGVDESQILRKLQRKFPDVVKVQTELVFINNFNYFYIVLCLNIPDIYISYYELFVFITLRK